MTVRVVRPHENIVIDLRERKDRKILVRFLPQPVFGKCLDFVALRKTGRVQWCAIHVDARQAVEWIIKLLRSCVVDAIVSDNAFRIVPVLASDGPMLEKAVSVGWGVVHVTAAVEVASEQENRNKPEAKPRMGWVRRSAMVRPASLKYPRCASSRTLWKPTWPRARCPADGVSCHHAGPGNTCRSAGRTLTPRAPHTRTRLRRTAASSRRGSRKSRTRTALRHGAPPRRTPPAAAREQGDSSTPQPPRRS